MKSRHFTWMRKKLKTPIPEKEKSATTTKCEQCIASIIAPRVVRTFNPRIKKQQCVACICKWHGSSVRFILCIKDTRDDAIALEYEIPFARIEYCGPDRFLCAYMRHTGEWFDMCFGQPESLTECLRMVAEDTHFDVSFIAYS